MPTKLYVSNISPNCTEADLQGLFSQYGVVTELDIIKNYAFVHMENHSEAQKAVTALNNKDFQGNNLQVQFSIIQNINRSNKSSVRYDRPDGNFRGRGGGNFSGRGGFQNRGGFQGGPGGDFRGRGDDFRGRGGFHGDRVGFQGYHRGRGKPYERPFTPPRGNFQGPNNQFNPNSNLQPVGPAGALSGFQRPNMPQTPNMARPQQNHPVPLTQQSPLQQQVHPVPPPQIQPTGPGIPAQHQVFYQPQAPPNPLGPQASAIHPAPFNNVMVPNQPSAQTVPTPTQPQMVTPVGNPAQPTALHQPVAQQNLPATNIQGGALTQQPVPASSTVYEKFVCERSYSNPAEVQTAPPQPNTATAPTVYQQIGQTLGQVPTNKDPYTNAQMQYERHAVATSRAAVYANAYYGSNAASPAVPVASVMQTMPVAVPSPVVQPIQVQYQQ